MHKRFSFLLAVAVLAVGEGKVLAGVAVNPTFTALAPLNVGNGPFSVCAGDVNGDGKLDLICADNGVRSVQPFGAADHTLTVLTNNGSGGFVFSSTLSVGTGPACVIAADVNGDQKVDLIAANFTDATLSVLTNNGSDGFVTASTTHVDDLPRCVIAADVNGDGKLDLISANRGPATLTVLTNVGGGVFVAASTNTVGIGPVSICAADINGDGKVDLVSANFNGGTLTALTNNGHGGFATAATLGVGNGPSSVCAADVNGDGKVDLICANATDGTLTVLTNDGRGRFVTASTPKVGNNPQCVIAADLNGDGKPDLISANAGDNTLTVLTNDGSGGFVLARTLSVGAGPISVIAADLIGDGNLDLVSANQNDNTLTVWLVSSPWTPALLGTNVALWLDAANTNSFVFNGGTNVSEWKDLSGNGNNVTNGNVPTEPSYETNGLNGLPTVNFPTTGLGLFGSNNFGVSGSAPRALAAVMDDGMVATGTPMPGNQGFGFDVSGSAAFCPFFDGTADITTNTGALAAANVLLGEFFNGSCLGFTNGSLFGSTNIAPGTVPGPIQLGTRGDGQTRTGQISEILYVNGGLPNNEQQLVEGYLAWKWGLEGSLPVNHPFHGAAPTVSACNVSASPANGGSVTGAGIFVTGSTNTISATANSGFAFTGWSGGGVTGTNSPLLVTVNSNLNITANFILLRSLQVTVNPVGAGSVSGAGTVQTGSTNTLMATANSGFAFVGWSGDALATNNPLTVVVNTNLSVTANFAATAGTFTVFVTTNGNGGVTPNLNRKALKKGQMVTLTAKATATTLFSNWTGSFTSAKNPLTIKAESNLELRANFVPNPFLPVKGTFNGIFAKTNGVTETTAGMLRGLTINQKGAYSGTLLINGGSKAVSGAFDLSGQASNHIARPNNQGGALTLLMAFDDTNGVPEVTGTVSGIEGGVPWVADLTADFATNAVPSAEFTMLMRADAANAPPTNSPGGFGYALITNFMGTLKNPGSANAKITGALADGTAFSQTTPVSSDGYIPVYANLYNNKGLLLGWINLGTNTDNVGLTWIHPKTVSGLYKGGFTNIQRVADILASPWTNLSTTAVLLPLTNCSLRATFTANDFFNAPIAVSNNFKLGQTSGTTNVSGTINRATGLMTVAVGSGPNKITGHGAFLINDNFFFGGGYFLTKSNAQEILVNGPGN